MRLPALLELGFWCALAIVMACFQSAIVLFGLQTVFGSVQETPAVVLQNLALISPVFPTLIGILALVRLFGSGLSFAEIIGFKAGSLKTDLAIGLAFGLLSIAITAASLRIMSGVTPIPPLQNLPAHFHLYFATVGALLPGFFEEVYFRRLLMKLGASLPVAVSLVISAAVFAVWHIGSPAYLVHTFILGLVWGSLFIRTGRLLPSIIAHSSANGLFGLSFYCGLPLV